MLVDRERTRENGFSSLGLFDRGIVDSAILVSGGRRLRTTPIAAIIVVAAVVVVVVVPRSVEVVVVARVALRKPTFFSKVTGAATIVAWL